MSRFILCSGRNCVLAVNTIVGRLLSALDFGVIRQRTWLGSTVAGFIALSVVTILVFGIPVGSVVYTSRLT